MGRVKDTAGRPLKWGEKSKLMYLPIRLEKQIQQFVKSILEKEKSEK